MIGCWFNDWPNRVVELEMSDTTKPKRYAIQLKDGGYYGQEWTGLSRTYPTWKTKGGAERALKRLTLRGQIK